MNRIKELREERGMKQSELGKLLNVKDAAISKYESGKIPLTGETLLALSKIFSKSVDYILGNDDFPFERSDLDWRNPPVQNRFGTILMNYRRENGLSIEDTAKTLDIQPALELELEQGIYTPSMELLKKVSKMTGYDIDFLIGATCQTNVPTEDTAECFNGQWPVFRSAFDFSFRSRFEDLCLRNNIDQSNSREKLGITPADYVDLKFNRMPTLSELLRIAYAFDVSVDYLVGKTDTPFSGLSKDELQLILNYRDCIEPYKKSIQDRAEKLCNESLMRSSIAVEEPAKLAK